MTLSVNILEAVWIALNLSTTVLTLSAFTDAWADRRAIHLLNGHAREMAASSIVRREGFRLAVQALLLAAVIPGLFIEGGASLHPTVVALMAVPVVLFANSAFDARDRKRMTILVAADIMAESKSAMNRLEDAVAENTHLTIEAAKKAGEAFVAANDVNEKIASHGAALIQQGQEQVIASDAVQRMETTVEHTAEQVEDIHHVTVRDEP